MHPLKYSALLRIVLTGIILSLNATAQPLNDKTIFPSWNYQINAYNKKFHSPTRVIRIKLNSYSDGMTNSMVILTFIPFNSRQPRISLAERPFSQFSYEWTGKIPKDGRFILYVVSLPNPGGLAFSPFENSDGSNINIELSEDKNGFLSMK